MAVAQVVHAVVFEHFKHQGLERKRSFYQFF